MFVWFAVSLLLLAGWWLRIGKEKGGFGQSCPKKHWLSIFDVGLVGLVYVGTNVLLNHFFGANDPSAREQLNNRTLGGLIGWQFLMAGIILLVAKWRFEAGLRGFWGKATQLKRTLLLAGVYFIAATGLTLLTLEVTVWICQWFGYEQVQRHVLLEMLSDNPPLLTKVLLVLSAAVGASLMEELLFRGIIQNFLVGFVVHGRKPVAGPNPEADGPTELLNKGELWQTGRWIGIMMTSVLFAITHNDPQHMPALFVLGMFLGYLYEKHGNLPAVILVHGLFNSMAVIGTLSQNGG
ncbi:MAG: CPBP family intramembrane metalloprotease [Sedimentisphaerales bacterium]|nr:CPBP family intramembrane metalloprotease [Sedimentisphaerales bacterium]